MKKELLSKTLAMGVIVLFIGVSVTTSTGKIATVKTIMNDGNLLGYVNDTFGHPIEGALVRVHFHETYEEDYSDPDGFYHVTNIPICYCLKNATCSKDGYIKEWVLLSIAENTTHDFVLTLDDNQAPKAPTINGPHEGGNGETLTFTFNAVDPDGDDVRFHIDWGDGNSETTVYVQSGMDIEVEHMWNTWTTFIIKAYAEDEYGNIGPSSTMSIPILRNKPFNFNFNHILQVFKPRTKSTEDNNEIEPLDNYEEIITRIHGDCTLVTRIGFYRFEPINIYTDWYYYSFEIRGLKKPSEKNDIFFKERPSSVKAPIFYGWVTNPFSGVIRVNGFAFGNIEWSE